ncbi:unnamed protein product [Mytilus coruscus]|uniref:Uncharacterized protein n=1 Tax=Mytilus coruscus TaxID=42192 RepID=A0A6J8E1A6_MYTCO|nr:unnamed protein product [Mytilus coruscus]
MVIVEKADGKLRICLDPKDLNRAIKREHFILPRQDEITAKLAGAKYFSKLDASSGFWNNKLDEESSNLCAFNAPFGRFKFLRLPFGSVPQSLWGCTKEEHDKRLKEVLERIRTANLKLRRDKCEIGISEVTYFGYRYTREGLKIDDNKVKAITEMKSPTTKKEFERFLGIVTYIAKFVPNFSSNTAVLRDLLKKDVPFQWNDNHDKTFKDLKTLITNSPVLRYFNNTKPVKLSVDASQNGLGAVL